MVRLLRFAALWLRASVMFLSIPQWCDCCASSANVMAIYFYAFNPTMVRLLPGISNLLCQDQTCFQSHNGAIAAGEQNEGTAATATLSIPQWCDCCRSLWTKGRPLPLSFQSHNGAIAALLIMNLSNKPRLLSIPQWCDCCYLYFNNLARKLDSFQSHNGAIAAADTLSVTA